MRHSRHQRAFTLVELLTAMAVLGILVVILAQSVGMVSDAWRAGKARIDNFSQARLAMSLLDRDLQSAILRKDLAAFVDENGDPACGFYTEMRGDTGDRKVSLVEYFLDTTGANPKLMRKDLGMNYLTVAEDGEQPRTLTLGNPTSLPDLADDTENLSTVDVAEGVLAFNWQFITNDGSLVTTEEALADNVITYENDSGDEVTANVVFNHDDPDSPTNIRAMVISMVILDGGTERLAEDMDIISDLVANFDGSPESGDTYAEYWNGKVTDLQQSTESDIPVLVRQSVRVFERTVQLPLSP